MKRERIAMRARRPAADVSIVSIKATSPEARDLMAALDAELKVRYPGHPTHGLHERELQDSSTVFLVARLGDEAIGCGAVRWLGPGVAEIKRMYVRPAYRRKGLALRILEALEAAVQSQGIGVIRLETGVGQPEALRLYRSAGYEAIPTFGEYAGDPLSRCFEKRLG